MAGKTRIEHDSFGPLQVPFAALYGAQTQRAVQNFPISGLRMPRAFLRALGLIKAAAAEANGSLGLLPKAVAKAIGDAALQVATGELDDQFPIDLFQTGSGTSSNMNANEVIATLASRKLGKAVHPNDQVNLGQSSNDVIPTAIQVAAAIAYARASGGRAVIGKLEDIEKMLTGSAGTVIEAADVPTEFWAVSA